ncbi:MAG: AAA family ATPase [Candidatus Poribacteria bacterium]|nr:AAA family ATPase [Candidatus Poribacteria bacterium]
MLNSSKTYPGLLIPTHRTGIINYYDADNPIQKTINEKAIEQGEEIIKTQSKPYGNTLTGWQLKSFTAEEWIQQLEAGHTIQPSLFKSTPDGKFTHDKETWESTYFVCADADNIIRVDFDKDGKDENPNGLEPWEEADGLLTRFPELKDEAYAIGQSVSSMSTDKNPPHRRHRIIFVFDEPITSPEEYNFILQVFAQKYPIIPNTTRSPAQPVFGNARHGYGFDILDNILSLAKYQMPAEVKEPPPKSKLLNSNYDETLEQFLNRHGIQFTPDNNKPDKFFLPCPYQNEHASGVNTPTDTYVFSDEKGWGFYCAHDTCKQKGRNTWNSFKVGMGIQSKKQNGNTKGKPQEHAAVLKQARQAFVKMCDTQIPLADTKQAFTETYKAKLTEREIEDIFNDVATPFIFETALELSEKELTEIDYIVPTLLPEGLTILAGDAKIGKSFFCWNLALAVASGGKALSAIDIEKPRSVMFFCLEESQRSIRGRLHKLLPDGILPDNIFIAYTFPNPYLLDKLGLWRLEEYIDENEIELIIVDTWQHVRPTTYASGSAYDIDVESLAPVLEFAHRKQIGVVLVTHTRKATDPDNKYNKMQGSTGIQSTCDTLMLLEKAEQGGNHCLLSITGREFTEQEYIMELTDGGLWKLHGDASDFQDSDARNRIVTILKDAQEDGMTLSEIAEETATSKQNVGKHLKTLKYEGKVYQPKTRGKYYHPDHCQVQPDEDVDDPHADVGY